MSNRLFNRWDIQGNGESRHQDRRIRPQRRSCKRRPRRSLPHDLAGQAENSFAARTRRRGGSGHRHLALEKIVDVSVMVQRGNHEHVDLHDQQHSRNLHLPAAMMASAIHESRILPDCRRVMLQNVAVGFCPLFSLSPLPACGERVSHSAGRVRGRRLARTWLLDVCAPQGAVCGCACCCAIITSRRTIQSDSAHRVER